MVYYQAVVHVFTSKQSLFCELMPVLAKLVEDRPEIGFKLVAAYAAVTGEPHTFVNVWQARDANAVIALPSEIQKFPEISRVFGELQPCIERETYQILVKAPYTP